MNVLSENPGFSGSTVICCRSQSFVTPVPGGLIPSSGLPTVPGIHVYADIHKDKKIIYIKFKIRKKINKKVGRGKIC